MSLPQTDEQFDDFFRDRLLGSEKDPTEDLWKKLAPAVKKNNFLTFGFRHFNIYLVLISGFLLTLLLFVYWRNQTDNPASISKEQAAPTVAPNDFQTVPLAEEQKHAPVKEKTAELKKDKKAQSSSVERSKSTLQDSSVNTQIPFVPVPDPVIADDKKPEIKSPKIKTIVTVIEQDTLIKKDTVNVRKKRNRK